MKKLSVFSLENIPPNSSLYPKGEVHWFMSPAPVPFTKLETIHKVYFRDFVNFTYSRIMEGDLNILAGKILNLRRVNTNVSDSLEDPRCFRFQGHNYLVFNNQFTMFVGDPERKIVVPLVYQDLSFHSHVQKNWSPIPLKRPQMLLFLYSYDPLVIFQCPNLENGKCYPYKGLLTKDIPIKNIRGGTPFVSLPLSPDIYASIGHTWHWWDQGNYATYKPIPTLYDSRSRDMKVLAPFEFPGYEGENIQYPTSLDLLENGEAVIGAHFKDQEFAFYKTQTIDLFRN